MLKKLFKKAAVLAVVSVLLVGNVIGASAYYASLSTTWKGYSAAGLNVVTETLHATGDRTSTTGEVYDVWLTTDRCYILNEVFNEITWTAKHPLGEYAKGSFKVKVGIPTPWGTVGTSGTTYTLSILF